jgi:hypothetical protein
MIACDGRNLTLLVAVTPREEGPVLVGEQIRGIPNKNKLTAGEGSGISGEGTRQVEELEEFCCPL